MGGRQNCDWNGGDAVQASGVMCLRTRVLLSRTRQWARDLDGNRHGCQIFWNKPCRMVRGISAVMSCKHL